MFKDKNDISSPLSYRTVSKLEQTSLS